MHSAIRLEIFFSRGGAKICGLEISEGGARRFSLIPDVFFNFFRGGGVWFFLGVYSRILGLKGGAKIVLDMGLEGGAKTRSSRILAKIGTKVPEICQNNKNLTSFSA